jgi:hypothetical protein
MREAARRALRQADEAQHVGHQRARRRIGFGAVDHQRFHDDVFDRHARIERAIGVPAINSLTRFVMQQT